MADLQHKTSDVILNERGPERLRGPEERRLFGVGSGVASDESALQNLGPEMGAAGTSKPVNLFSSKLFSKPLIPFTKNIPPLLQGIIPIRRRMES